MTKPIKIFIPAFIAMICVVASCTQPQNNSMGNQNATKDTTTAQMDDDNDMNIHKAVAVIHSNNMKVDAWVTFTKVEQGVRVHGEFSGFPSGAHASHIHVYGDCRADDYSSAGPHLQFSGEDSLGSNNPITGNLGEFSASSGQTAVIDTVIKVIEFKNIIGRAVMVHQKGNDLSPPPPGQSGARIACGVIGFAKADSASGGMNNM